MADSATVTRYGGSVKVASIAWTSSAGGASVAGVVHIDGQIQRVTTDPAAAGSAPTDNYDITLVDANGYDLAAGQLVDRDTANTETVVLTVPIVHYGPVTVTVAAAGDSKSGTVLIYYR